MRREHIEDLIAKEVEQIIEGTDLELVDVEYVRERNWYLRVFIDKEGGVDLEDCQAVSEKLSKVLDEKDPISDNSWKYRRRDWTASSRRTRTSSATPAGP